MEKEVLEGYLNKGLSLRQITKETNKSLTSIRYWTKKYNLSSRFGDFKNWPKKEYGNTRFCPKCKKDRVITDFFKRRGKLFSSSYCRECLQSRTLERMLKFKKDCVEYKGGKCILCGYDKYNGALEFHHIDPHMKSFNISSVRSWSFDDIVRHELDMCVLLCANCHREVEAGIVVLK